MIMLLLAFTTPAFAVETIPLTPAKQALYDDLTSNMSCQCGCGTTLKTCPHENCTSAVPARKEILGFIDKGMDREGVKTAMVALHGEVILSQPMFRGFNVMAWITPFIVILVVGYIVALMVKKWSSVRVAPPAAPKGETVPGAGENDPYLRKMRDELDKFEE